MRSAIIVTLSVLIVAALAGLAYAEISGLRGDLDAERAAYADDRARWDRDRRRLEDELRTAIDQRQVVVDQIEATKDEMTQLREDRLERIAQANKPMPAGVRLALRTINNQLLQDGYGTMRFLRAERIEERAMFGAEFTEYRPEEFATRFYYAGRVEFELDRATAALTMRCFEGRVYSAGDTHQFPPDGEAIVLSSVAALDWENRLPYLLRTTGVAPVEVEEEPDRPAIDAATARIWSERMDGLVRSGETEFELRVARVRDLRDGVFRDVLIHGYDDSGRLQTSMSAKRLQIEVDQAAGTVALLMRGGTMLRHEGTVTIPAEGYRVLLMGVSPAAARDAMLGMVARAR